MLAVGGRAAVAQDEYSRAMFKKHFLTTYERYRETVDNWLWQLRLECINASSGIVNITCHAGDQLMCQDDHPGLTNFWEHKIILVGDKSSSHLSYEERNVLWQAF